METVAEVCAAEVGALRRRIDAIASPDREWTLLALAVPWDGGDGDAGARMLASEADLVAALHASGKDLVSLVAEAGRDVGDLPKEHLAPDVGHLEVEEDQVYVGEDFGEGFRFQDGAHGGQLMLDAAFADHAHHLGDGVDRPSGADDSCALGPKGSGETGADAYPTLRAVVLSGSGERAFCAGDDMKATGGKANPKAVNEIVARKLASA